MVLESSIFNCYPPSLLVPNLALASVDGFIALVAFYQLTRVHMRNKEVGWTCQKVLHLMIASSNLGYLIYFISTLLAFLLLVMGGFTGLMLVALSSWGRPLPSGE
ncbi:hypothetical protein CUMW_138530 [Citrus unshiu]|uniref:THH1/TOM1/TOM3 domain-containing protein n=1 Tax=Citrus unshiu TaxID=55188 RepID=A0A2H5PIQ4_CITUN|nr:hypothetical protein CUMW_138530 [Citrus unshiu]